MMGVSPWRTNLTHGVSPEGTTGNDSQTIHVAPSGLLDLVLLPTSTGSRPWLQHTVPSGLTWHRRHASSLTIIDSTAGVVAACRRLLATKWRNDVAMGVSPWNTNPTHRASPEGTTGKGTLTIHVAPSGLFDRVRPRIHGLAPVATIYRPFRD